MKAGDLRHVGNIISRVRTTDKGRGNPVLTPTNLYTDVPMAVDPLHGKQLEIARQLVGTATHRITLRWESGITAGMQVVIETRVFNIGYVDDGDYLQHDMYLTVTEQTTGAV